MSNAIAQLAADVGKALKAADYKLVTAESCTAGGLGFWITSVPGSSDWFDRGFITYSNQSKVDLLGVNPETINIHGAVSEQTAHAMAEGALKNSRADLAIAITGIAGPDGGDTNKPVGTVWIACAGRGMATIAEVDIYPGDRQAVRLGAIERALQRVHTLLRSQSS